jgi:hypothetical protein
MDRRTDHREGPRQVAPAFGRLVCALALALAAAPAPAQDADADASAHPAMTDDVARTRSVSLGFLNDFLAPKGRLQDDDGFSAGMGLEVDVPTDHRSAVRVGVSSQMITERGGVDRVDDARVYARWRHALGESPRRGTTLGWMVGLQVVGDLGGSRVQDWAHRTVFTGRHLEGLGVGRLQYRYLSGYDVLVDVGASVETVHPLGGPWSVHGGVEGTLGAGTGFFGELRPFVAIAYATDRVEVELRQGAGMYGTNVRPLSMRGGYVTGVLQSQPALRVAVLGPRATTLTLSLEWNQGNSGQHVGAVWLGRRF